MNEMNELDLQYKDICKSYFKFCAVIYGIYLGFLVMLVKGHDIVEWFSGKISALKNKFRRKEDPEEEY